MYVSADAYIKSVEATLGPQSPKPSRHDKADKSNEVAEAEASDDHEVAWNCNQLIRPTMAEEYKTK